MNLLSVAVTIVVNVNTSAMHTEQSGVECGCACFRCRIFRIT